MVKKEIPAATKESLPREGSARSVEIVGLFGRVIVGPASRSRSSRVGTGVAQQPSPAGQGHDVVLAQLHLLGAVAVPAGQTQ